MKNYFELPKPYNASMKYSSDFCRNIFVSVKNLFELLKPNSISVKNFLELLIPNSISVKNHFAPPQAFNVSVKTIVFW